MAQAFAIFQGFFGALEHALVLMGYHHHLDFGGVDAVDHVLFGKKMGGGHGHRAQLVQRHQNRPELQMAAQDEHDLIALADAQRMKQVGRAVAFLLQLPKGITNHRAGFIRPQHGQAVGLLYGDAVGHIVGKIEAFWPRDMEFFIEIIISGKGRGAI